MVVRSRDHVCVRHFHERFIIYGTYVSESMNFLLETPEPMASPILNRLLILPLDQNDHAYVLTTVVLRIDHLELV